MTAVLAQLGGVGVALVLVVATATIYTAALQFRPGASWYLDLELVRIRITSSKQPGTPSRRSPLAMAHDLWPVCVVGPRTWRWPLNSTRFVSASIWSIIRPNERLTRAGYVQPTRRGLLWSTLRLSWYISTGLGAAAAIAQAFTLVLVVTVPIKALLFVFDTATVLRGGSPPALTTRATIQAGDDWDRALADLVETEPANEPIPTTEYGIRLGPDGQALDPADQYRLDQARQTADREWLDNDRARQAELLDRMERLQRRDRQ